MIFSNKIPLALPAYHKNPQINRKTSLHFTCFTSLFSFFSRRSFSSRSLLDNTDELRHCTRLVSASGSGCFSSTISICNIHLLQGKVSSLTLNGNMKEKSRQ